MARARKELFQCQVCKQEKEQTEVIPGSLVRNRIVVRIQQTVPSRSSKRYICLIDLNLHVEQHLYPRDLYAKILPEAELVLKF